MTSNTLSRRAHSTAYYKAQALVLGMEYNSNFWCLRDKDGNYFNPDTMERVYDHQLLMMLADGGKLGKRR